MQSLDCVFCCLETPHSMYSMGLFTLGRSQERHTSLEWNLPVLRMFSVKAHHNLLGVGTHGIGHSCAWPCFKQQPPQKGKDA